MGKFDKLNQELVRVNNAQGGPNAAALDDRFQLLNNTLVNTQQEWEDYVARRQQEQEALDEYSHGRGNRSYLREGMAEGSYQAGMAAAKDQRTTAQKRIDKLLGVDSSQVTGEKTDWWKIAKGAWYKGADQFSTSMAGGLNWLFGDAAEQIHSLGIETINGIIGGVNSLTGANIKPVENKGNLLTNWYETLKETKAHNEKVFAANANSSKAAQIVDNFGTSFVAAVPMALEALMTAPYAAAKAGATATTAGLQYVSGLQAAKGMEAAGMMARQSASTLMQNPQFWSSYVQAIGDSAETAEESGMSPRDAAIYTMINSFFNAVIEVGGADETLGGIQNFPMRLRQLEEQGGKKAVVEWFKDSVLGEGMEEVAQGIFERGVKAPATGAKVASLNPGDTDAIFNPWTSAQEFTGGAVVGGLLGGGQTVIQGGVQKINDNRAFKGDAQTLLDSAKQSGGEQYAAQIREIEQAAKGKDGSVKLNRGQARQLYDIIESSGAAEQYRETVNQKATAQSAEGLVSSVFADGDIELTDQQRGRIMETMSEGSAGIADFAMGTREAYEMGERGATMEETVQAMGEKYGLTPKQARTAWGFGASENSTGTRTKARAEYGSIEEFSKTFDNPQEVKDLFEKSALTDVNEFAEGFQAAYDMGRSGVGKSYLSGSDEAGNAYVPLSGELRTAAYEMGRQNAQSTASARADKISSSRKSGNLARTKGVVRGEGVSMADLRKTFNDRQNTAYRLLTRYAETTGVNIVLYRSQADENGQFPEAQGRFQWKDNTIYLDINSGLNGVQDAGSLGQYTMMRVFAHEFTHFIEKWNPTQYNEFREFVFATLEERGENVHDLIEDKQRLDSSGKMSYEQASREVVADGMMDILPDSRLVQQLAQEHQTIFQKLLQKMREFAARLRQHYQEYSVSAPREAEALKANSQYLDGIVKMWDEIAKGAVENYQSATGEALFDQPGKPANLPKRNARQQRNNAQIREEIAQNEEEMPAQAAAEAEESAAAENEESTRRQTISDREVLRMAAGEIDVEGLSEGEKDALRIFNEALDKLQEAQEQREELGRQYREQQFTKGGSRTEAAQTLARMNVLDSKVKTLENRLLSLENKDVLKRVLQKARAVVEAQEKARGKEALQKYREKRDTSEATKKYRERVRAQVMEFAKFMTSPSNKDIRKHVPAELQKSVVDFLESINLASKTALRTGGLETTKADDKYLKTMKKLKAAIKQNVDSSGLYSGFADLPEDFMENFDAMIERAEELMQRNSGEFVVNQMSAKDLKELSRVLKVLKQHIQTMNVFHNNAMFQHVDEAGESSIEHLGKFRKSRAGGTAYKFLRFDYMRPSMAFDHFGDGGRSIVKELQEGQAEQAFLANEIIGFAKKTYSGKEVKAWSEDVKTFTLSDGKEISLPVTHIMSLYCLNKRAQALTHIYGDGIRVANYKADGKVQLDEGHIVTMDDVQKMVQSLTPRQFEVADALQKYMSTECAKWGNHVSMKRFGVEQFGEENYFPINSDGRYLPATADESPSNSGLYALLNMGFTKELKENAKNRIILYNIFDVFANHTASMTQYRAFALPVLDALRWFNYKNDATSVRDKLSMAFGAPEDARAGSGSKGYAESFVIELLRAYNGTAAQGDPYDTIGLKMLHRFNGAQIAYNLRVIIQQPAAIARAAMILSPAKLTKGLGMSITQMRKLADEMEKHSGIAAWKALGFYDTNISRGLTELIKQNPSTLDKVMDVGTTGAEQADRFTWAAMWYAAKDSVKRSEYSSEDAYWKAVTDLFEETIYKTQVVDSILTKAEFLRAKGGIARQLGSFMSEPSATMSMLADAWYKYTDDMQQGKSRSEAWQRNGGNIAKTAAVYAVSNVILAAMQAVMDAWRDDDEYDRESWLSNFLQKYAQAFKGNIIEEMLPFGKVPIVSEMYEVFKSWMDYAGVFKKLNLDLYGSDISSGLSMYLKYIDKTAKIIMDKTGISGNKSGYTNYGVIYNLVRGVSNIAGIPAAAAMREVVTLWNNTVGFFAPSKKLVTYERAADRKKRETYRIAQEAGISQATYYALYDKADVDGDGIEQGEFGPVLMEAIKNGEITEEQAAAAWKANWNKGNSTTFEKWRAKNSGEAATQEASKPQTETPKPTPTPKPQASLSDFESFKKSVSLYSDKKEAAYRGWENEVKPLGVSLDSYVKIINAADAAGDGNGSVKQDEMGMQLVQKINRRELTYEQAEAIWHTIWSGARSKTFYKWYNG